MAANWTLLGLDAGKQMKVRSTPVLQPTLVSLLSLENTAEVGIAPTGVLMPIPAVIRM